MASQRGGSPPVPQLKEIKHVIHSMLCTNKGAVTLDTIAKDYLTIESHPLPYKQLGFSSLEDFLKSLTDVVQLTYTGGVCMVRAVAIDSTQHIQKLVAGQKNSGKRNVVKIQKTFVNNIRPNYQSGRIRPHRFNAANTARQAPWSPYIPPNMRAPQPVHMFRPWMPMPSTQQPKPEHQSTAQATRPTPVAAPYHEFRPMMPAQPPVTQNQQVQQMQQVKPKQPAQQKLSQQSLPSTQPTAEKKVTFALPQPSQYNQAPPASPNTQLAFSYDRANASKEDYREKLARFIKLHKLAEPEYESVQTKRGPWIASVSVTFENEKIKFHSYPDTFQKEEEALEKAAENALEELEEKYEASLSNLPVTTDKMVLAKRIFDLVSKSPQGFLSGAIPKMYADEHREKVPPQWIQLVQSTTDSLEFELIKQADQKTANYIITISKPKAASPLPPVAEEPPQAPPSGDQQFDDTTWAVHVQVILSACHIGIRRIDQSKEWDESITEMELFYGRNQLKSVQKESLNETTLYVANIQESWYRIEFKKLIDETKQASVFLVDLADFEDVPLSDIYPLEERFVAIPRLGEVCLLHGLSAFTGSKFAETQVVERLFNRPFTAQVVSRHPEISLILIDESEGRVEYVNEKIVEILAEHAQPDSLKIGALQKSVISHVSPTCDIYLLRDTPQQNAVDALVSLVAKRIGEADAATDLSDTKLFLGSSEKRDWCRMRLCTVDSKVSVQLVDFGDVEDVAGKTLIDLQTVSPVLARLPDQVVKVVLAGVPPQGKVFNEKAAEVLRNVIPPDVNALARIVRINNEGRPVVELFERLPDGKIASVNAALELNEAIYKPYEPPARRLSASQRNGDLSQRLNSMSLGSRQSSTGSLSSSESDPVTVTVPEADIPPIDKDHMEKPIQVQVLNASNPHHFYVQNVLTSQALSALTRRMQELFVEDKSSKVETVAVGGFYAALHAKTQSYRRVQVIRKLGSDCQVVFVDYGDMNVVAASDLKPLHQELAELPAQAIKAKLHGVKPGDGDWSPLDAFFFQQAVGDKVFSSYVTEILPDKTVVLELIDSIDGRDSSVAQSLIDKSHAISA